MSIVLEAFKERRRVVAGKMIDGNQRMQDTHEGLDFVHGYHLDELH